MQTETDYVITALYSSVLVTLLIAIVIGIALFICERVLKHTPLKDVLKDPDIGIWRPEYYGSVLTSTRPLNNKRRLELWQAKQLAPRTFPLKH